MKSPGGWLLGGAAAIGLLLVGIASLFGQRFGSPDGRGGEVGRYVVVRNTDDGIIIMDSTNGDLYKATQADIKPYATRPHGMWADKEKGFDKVAYPDKDKTDKVYFDKGPPPEKDKGFKDKDPFDKEKAFDKEKSPIKEKEKQD